MNVRMLKAKRVERGLRQKDLANALGITEKAMCHKECSDENKFKAAEMLTLIDELDLSFAEFDAIFFNHELTKRLRRIKKMRTIGKYEVKEKGMRSSARPARRVPSDSFHLLTGSLTQLPEKGKIFMQKLIYICSPLQGDVKTNLENAKKYSRLASYSGIPITPHLYFTTFLDDNSTFDRHLGIQMGLQLLEICQEMWVYADEVTEGMIDEIKKAQELNIPIKFHNADREEIKYDSLIINHRIGPGLRKIIADINGDSSAAGICPYAADCGKLRGEESGAGKDTSKAGESRKRSIWDRITGRK